MTAGAGGLAARCGRHFMRSQDTYRMLRISVPAAAKATGNRNLSLKGGAGRERWAGKGKIGVPDTVLNRKRCLSESKIEDAYFDVLDVSMRKRRCFPIRILSPRAPREYHRVPRSGRTADRTIDLRRGG